MKWFNLRRRTLRSGGEEGVFSAERHLTTSRRRRVIVAFLGLASLVGWSYVFFGSGIFRIATVDVGNLKSLERGEVIQEVMSILDEQSGWPWNRRNLLLVNGESVARELEKRLYAERVVVKKIYPNVLRLNIEERQSSVVLIANNEFYLVDRKGLISKRISSEEEVAVMKRISKPSQTPEMPVLTIRNTSSKAVGEALVDDYTVQRWLQAFQELSRAGFGYRNAILEHPTSTKLILNMFEPYDVHFDLFTPMQSQIQSYYAFIKTRSPGTTIYSYVDARIPGKIYYK